MEEYNPSSSRLQRKSRAGLLRPSGAQESSREVVKMQILTPKI